MTGHEGRLMGGKVASLMTFSARGLVVAVMANTSYADTRQVGLRVSEVFAGRARGSSRR
jgi:hypothetical protein